MIKDFCDYLTNVSIVRFQGAKTLSLPLTIMSQVCSKSYAASCEFNKHLRNGPIDWKNWWRDHWLSGRTKSRTETRTRADRPRESVLHPTGLSAAVRRSGGLRISAALRKSYWTLFFWGIMKRFLPPLLLKNRASPVISEVLRDQKGLRLRGEGVEKPPRQGELRPRRARQGLGSVHRTASTEPSRAVSITDRSHRRAWLRGSSSRWTVLSFRLRISTQI